MKRTVLGILLLLEVLAWAGTATWVGTTNTTYSVATNWLLGAKPVTGDDVVFGGAVNCNIDEATAALNSFNCTGYTGVLSGSSNIIVTVASGTVNVIFPRTGCTWTGTLLLNPATGAVINLEGDSAATGGTCGGITVAGTTTGVVNMLDGWTLAATKIVTLTSGTLNVDANTPVTHSWGLFSSSNSNTRTLTLGTSIIGITGTYIVWDTHIDTNLTVSTNTSTINLTGANAAFYTNTAKSYYTLNFTGSASNTIQLYSGNFVNLTYIPSVGAKANILSLVGSVAVTGSLTITGNSPTNRLLVYSYALGTPQTFTTTGATISTDNVDFRDITLNPGTNAQVLSSVADNGDGTVRFTTTGNHGLPTGTTTLTIVGTDNYNGNYTATKVAATTFDITHAYAAETLGAGHTWTYDLTNGGANLIGDCGGNTGATFTTAAAQTATGTSEHWSELNWGAGRIPLPQDTATIDMDTGQTITSDLLRLCRDISFNHNTAFTLANNITTYGSFDFTNSGTFTQGSYTWAFESKNRTGTNTLTSAGKTFTGAVTFSQAGTSVLALGDAFSSSSTVACGSTNSLNLGSYTHTFSRTTGTPFTSAGTITAGTSTIVYSDTGANAKTFAGAGKTFNNLSITSGGTGAIIITGNNTFNGTVAVTGTAGKTIQFADGSTNTAATWTLTGAAGAGNDIRISAVTAGGAQHFHIVKTGGGISLNNYLTVTDSVADTLNTFYYGANSTAPTRSTNWGIAPGGTAGWW